MKKNRIIAAAAVSAAALVLASCQISVTPTPKPVREYSFQSNWVNSSTNKPVACDNMETVFEYTFYAENPALIESITEHYHGVISETDKSSNVPSSAWAVDGHDVTVQAVFAAGGGFLPLSADAELGTQAIIVTPVAPPAPADVRGTTNFRVSVDYGYATFNLPATSVDIYANCTLD